MLEVATTSGVASGKRVAPRSLRVRRQALYRGLQPRIKLYDINSKSHFYSHSPHNGEFERIQQYNA